MLDNEGMKKRGRSARQRKFLIYGASLLLLVGLVIAATEWRGNMRPTAQPVAATAAARNDVRRAALQQMAAALSEYRATTGSWPAGLTPAPSDICVRTGAVCTAAHLTDLTILTSKGLLAALPSDPVGGHELYSTGYRINRDANGGIVLSAPRAEAGAVIAQTAK